MECINLKEVYGERYRITLDPAAETLAERKDPWMFTIRCKGRDCRFRPIIYPHSDKLLALEIDYKKTKRVLLQSLPGMITHQMGNNECTLLFPPELFDRVAEIVKPIARVKVSPEARAAAKARIQAGQAKRWLKKSQPPETAVG